MSKIAFELLEQMQGYSGRAEALRKVNARDVSRFEEWAQDVADSFDNCRQYLSVHTESIGYSSEGYVVKFFGNLYGDDDLFEFIIDQSDCYLWGDDVRFDMTQECGKIDSKLILIATIPEDYKQVLRKIGKLQTVTDTRETLVCGNL